MQSKRVGVFRRLVLKGAGLGTGVLLVTSAAFSQQKFEIPQETNDRIRQLSSAMHAKQGDYVIGSGDLVHIEVFDVPELSRDVRVGESGYISLPLLPVKLRASGLTAFQLEEKLAELLQSNGLVSHPQVTIFLRERRSQPITVIGAVGHPLVYQAMRQTTLLEVLSEAGGIANDAGNTLIVTRAATEPAPGKPGSLAGDPEGTAPPPMTFTISLSDLLDSGDSKFNIPLLSGDVVSVPRAGVVYVVGAVEKPGGIVLGSDREQMTTLKILALAGGLKSTARPHQAVIVRRNSDTGQHKELSVDLSKVLERKTEDVRLFPSDILFVPDSSGKKALHRAGDIAIALSSGVALVRLGR
jgi:polysaccharide export outer membrane protein